jgi:outer membrane lipoprotein SlyB
MNTEHHRILGVFTHRDDAQHALESLLARGVPSDQMTVVTADRTTAELDTNPASDAALKGILLDGAIGTAVGSGVGVVAEFALVAVNVSLFVASPLLAPLVMLGWGAALGGTLGAAVGVRKKDRSMAALIHDAVTGGYFPLLVRTRNAPATLVAQEVLRQALGTRDDVATV